LNSIERLALNLTFDLSSGSRHVVRSPESRTGPGFGNRRPAKTEGDRQFFGYADTDEATGSEGVAVHDQRAAASVEITLLRFT
jgi:hypothetical protein